LKKSQLVYSLNQDMSKTLNGTVSYSLCDNGSMCKYLKQNDDYWLKDRLVSLMKMKFSQKTFKRFYEFKLS